MKIPNTKNLYPRTILKDLIKELSKDNILTILGARQVGKTSILALLYDQLKNKSKVYFDLEDIQILQELNSLNFNDFPVWLEEKIGRPLAKKNYVFIDEIQYLDHPSSFLKYIFDHFKQIKFIVSGSSTLEIKKKFTDRLTGRKSLHILYPLSFEEFLVFQNKSFFTRDKLNLKEVINRNFKISHEHKKRVSFFQKELLKYFEEFVIFGGYPKAVLTKNKKDKFSILKEIQGTYVRKDIKDLADVENLSAFNNLIEVVALQSANLLNYDELTNTLNLNRKTLEKYLFLLENTFIISLLKPFFTNKRKEISKMPKIFLTDTGMRNALIQNFNALNLRPDKGALVENFVYTQLKKLIMIEDNLYFWGTQVKAEVDFIIKNKQNLIPIEVKYQKFKTSQIPSGLQSFISFYQPKKAVIITQDYLDQIKFKKTNIYFLPAFLI
ncbi:MAG: ATP-binding protein [Patescibacteria group bacterium]